MQPKQKQKLTYGEPVILTGTMSYADLFTEGQKLDGSSGGYSVKLLIPKADAATLTLVRRACQKTAAKKFGSKPRPYAFKIDPLRDGNVPNNAGKIYAGHPGHMYLTAKTKNKPQAVKVLGGVAYPLEESEVYSGMKVRVAVTPYVYSHGAGGISFLFQIVRKIADGARLTGYWECSIGGDGKIVKGKFVEGGGQKEESFGSDDEYQGDDVREEFDGDEDFEEIE